MDQFSYYMIRIRESSADDHPARPLAGVVEWLSSGEKQDFAGGEELLQLLSGPVERPPNMRAFTEGGKALSHAAPSVLSRFSLGQEAPHVHRPHTARMRTAIMNMKGHASFRLIGALVCLAAGVPGCNDGVPLAPDADQPAPAGSGAGGLGEPSDVTSTAVLPSQVNVAWKDNSTNETGFEVHRSTTGPVAAVTAVVAIGADVTAYSDADLTASTQYCYKVRALKANRSKTSYSAFSNTACATTPPPPAAPTELKASTVSSSRIDLAWIDNATNETGFTIERCQGDGCTAFAEIAQVDADIAVWVNTGLSGSTTYSYRVRARSGASFSTYSNVAAATTPAREPRRLTVTTTTAGVDLDSDGYWVDVWRPNDGGSVYLNGSSVPANGTTAIDVDVNPNIVLSPGGEYVAELSGTAMNCVLDSPNPQRIDGTGPLSVTFAITCSTVTQLAVASTADGNAEIYAVNANGTGRVRLTNHPASDVEPAWSPNGRAIAFTSDRDGNAEIYVMNADGSNPVRLTDAASTDGSPTWSPDGARIAFTSDRDGNREIHVMNADGTNVVNLSNHAADDGDPAWSPDGGRIAFRSSRDGYPGIYVMSADGSAVTRLTSDPWAEDSQPAWSPDGTALAFARSWCSGYGCKSDILVMFADGTWIEWLTDADGANGEAHSDPAWSPDGRWIAFASGGPSVDPARAGVFIIRVNRGTAEKLTDGSHPSWRR